MNAVDRMVGTCTRTLEIGLTAYYKTVWWKVDIGGVYNIYRINIQFKNYDGYGRYNFIFNYTKKKYKKKSIKKQIGELETVNYGKLFCVKAWCTSIVNEAFDLSLV